MPARPRLHSLIKFCSKNELLLCSNANTLETTGTLLGLQIGVVIWEGTVNQKCTGGTMEGATGPTSVEGPGAEESKLLGETTNLTFTGCEPCKIEKAIRLPVSFNLTHTSEVEKEAKLLWLIGGQLFFRLEECAFGVACTFGATELKPSPFIEMTATEVVLNTNKAVLRREEGSEFFCGSTIKWNAKYKLELKLTTGVVHNIWPTLCKKEASVNTCL